MSNNNGIDIMMNMCFTIVFVVLKNFI